MSEAPAERISLSGAAARGGLVLGAAGFIENASQFVRAVLLARILTPGDFGLMGMAFVAIQAGESFSQTGFYRALVQKKEDPAAYLDTVWVVNVLRGAALFTLMSLAAPIVGAFFVTPAAIPVVRAIATVFLIQGLLNPALFLLERDLAFARFVAPRLAGVIGDLVASVLLAVWLRSAWAMVWGYLIGKAIHVAGSYVARPFRPAMRFRRDQASEFYAYGKHIFRATFVDYVAGQADKALVGRLLGADALGLYSLGWRLASLPSTGLYSVVFRVAFPVFSRIQEHAERIRAGYLKTLTFMAAMSAPISAGLWAIASDLVMVVFGERWAGMIPSFKVLCLGGVCLALLSTIGAILNGIGRPKLTARGYYVCLGAVILFIYPAVRSAGIVGAAWCVTLASTASFGYFLVASARAIGCKVVDVLWRLAPPTLASVVMAGAVVAVRPILSAPTTWATLVGEVAAGIVVYSILVSLLDRILSTGLIPALRATWRSA